MLVNFSYILDNEIAGCAHPGGRGNSVEGVAELVQEGIGAIVSLDEEGIPVYVVADFGMHYLHLPVPDFESPTLDQGRRFVDFVRAQRESGRSIAIHCRAGYGRTGTMLACYLVWKGSTAQDAIAEVRRRRPGSIETREQELFVERFAREVIGKQR